MTKILKYFTTFIYSLVRAIINFNNRQFLISEKINNLKLKDKNKNLFVAFIERSSHTINFNYVEYLLNIKLLSKDKKCLIIILPESEKKKIYLKNNFLRNSNQLRYETILSPLFDLIEDFNPSILTFKNRIDAIEYFNLPREQKFPKDSVYENTNYKPFYVKDLYRNIINTNVRPIIKSQDHYLDLLNILHSNKNYKKIISISLRSAKNKNFISEIDKYRNSNLKVWLNVADWIKEELNFTPIIIPDITQIDLEDKDFRGHEVSRMASMNLNLRVALYQKSFLNLTISAGFSELLYHSNYSFLSFKFGDDRIKKYTNSVEDNESTYGIKKGEQLPFLTKKQKIFWGEKSEEFNFIKDKINSFMDNHL
ncbi:hypothetical protein OA430_00580 [Candidatus Pelagibacter sp.]|nr:hypothetical protein [Candidatus Pelagibacter sp.]